MGLAVLQVLVLVVPVCIYKGVWAVKELQACGSTYFLSEFVALQRFTRQRSLCNCTRADPYQICSTDVSADLYARRSHPRIHSRSFKRKSVQTCTYAGLRESMSSETLVHICSLDLRRLAAWLIDAEMYSRVSKQNHA